jgi:hypothetical protein
MIAHVSPMAYLKRILPIGMLVLSLVPAATAAAQGRGRGHANGQSAAAKDEAIVIDREGHRRIVHEYYTQQALPPGLAKREALPPGLAKQVRERGALPPGLQKRMTPVPVPLVARPGCRRTTRAISREPI